MAMTKMGTNAPRIGVQAPGSRRPTGLLASKPLPARKRLVKKMTKGYTR